MGNRVLEVQEEAQRSRRITQLKLNTARFIAVDTIIINLKSFLNLAILCLATMYCFDFFKWDESLLVPTGLVLGLFQVFWFTLPEQRAAKALRALEMLHKMDQEGLLQKKVD